MSKKTKKEISQKRVEALLAEWEYLRRSFEYQKDYEEASKKKDNETEEEWLKRKRTVCKKWGIRSLKDPQKSYKEVRLLENPFFASDSDPMTGVIRVEGYEKEVFPLRDNSDWILLLVHINMPKEDIMQEVEKHIDISRQEKKPQERRLRLDKYNFNCQVYDLRC